MTYDLKKLLAANPDLRIADGNSLVRKLPPMPKTKARRVIEEVLHEKLTQRAHDPKAQTVLELPYPVSANRYWRNFRGRMVVSAEAKAYKKAAFASAIAQGAVCTDEPVSVAIHVRRPAKRRDLDNHLKVTLDALQGAVYTNDSQIIEIHVTMEDNKHNPGVTVTIKDMQDRSAKS